MLNTLAVGYVCSAPKIQTRAALGKFGAQEVTVMVKGGYSPDVVVVQRGLPVRFTFARQESATCSERVVFPDFDKNVSLPAYEETTLEFTPEEPGEYSFHYQMGMLHGKLIVE